MAESATHRILSTTTGTVLVDSISSATAITLPLASTFQGKSILFQTYSTSFNVSSVTLVAQGDDTFDSGQAYYKLQQSTQTAHFIAGNDQRWYEVGGLAPEGVFTSSLSTQQIAAESVTAASYVAPRNVQVDSIQAVTPFTPLQVPGLMSWINTKNASAYRGGIYSNALDSAIWYGIQDSCPNGLSWFTPSIQNVAQPFVTFQSNSQIYGDNTRVITSIANQNISTNFSLFIGFTSGSPGNPEHILFYEQTNALRLGLKSNATEYEFSMTINESISSGTSLCRFNSNTAEQRNLIEVTVSSGLLTTRLDGGLPFTSTISLAPHYAYYLGGDSSTTTDNQNGWNGFIGDVMVFSTPVTEFDRLRIESYFLKTSENFFGTPMQLPTNNPYLSTLPSALSPFTPPTFSPSSIPGLQTWLDGSAFQGQDGDPVFSWINRVNPENGVSTTYFPATYFSSSRSVYFDGGFRQLLGDINFFPTTSNSYFNPMYFAFVVQPSYCTTPMTFFYGGDSNVRSLHYGYSNSNGFARPFYNIPTSNILGSVDSINNRKVLQDIFGDLLQHVSTVEYNSGTFSNPKFFFASPAAASNREDQISLAFNSAPYYLSNTDAIKLGTPDLSNTFDISGAFTGNIYEILAFSTNITVNDQYALNEYLATKYNMNYGLDPTQPGYTSVQPTMTPLPANSPFSPSSISSCTLWFDAKDPFGTGVIPSDNSIIPTWKDKSGRSNDATTQANIAPLYNYPPIYSASLSSLVFLPYADAPRGVYRNPFYNLPQQSLPYNNDPYTIFVVASLTNAIPADYNPILVSGVNFDPALWLLQVPIQASNTASGFTANLYTAGNLYSGTYNTNTSPTMQTITHGSPFNDPTITMFLNGFQTVTKFQPQPSGAGYPCFIGKYGSNLTSAFGFLNGSIQEIIMYRSYLSAQDRQRVEGYLAHKWNIQIPLAHPYYTNLPTTSTLTAPPFEPSSLQGLRVWFDASDETSMTLSASTIQSWTNKAPNGVPFFITEGEGSNVEISTSILSGKSAAAFNGNTFLYTSTIDILPKPATAFFLGQTTYTFDEMSSKTPTIFTNGGFLDVLTKINSWDFIQSNDTPTGGSYSYSSRAGAFVTLTSVSVPNFKILDLYATCGTSTITITSLESEYKSALASNTPTLDSNLNFPYPYFCIGAPLNTADCLPSVANNTFKGHICEFLYYQGDLTTEARQKVEGYLAWKWGIENTLPTMHPYRYLNPT